MIKKENVFLGDLSLMQIFFLMHFHTEQIVWIWPISIDLPTEISSFRKVMFLTCLIYVL